MLPVYDRLGYVANRPPTEAEPIAIGTLELGPSDPAVLTLVTTQRGLDRLSLEPPLGLHREPHRAGLGLIRWEDGGCLLVTEPARVRSPTSPSPGFERIMVQLHAEELACGNGSISDGQQ